MIALIGCTVLIILSQSLIGTACALAYIIWKLCAHFGKKTEKVCGCVLVLIIASSFLGLATYKTSVTFEVIYHFFHYPAGTIRDVYLNHLDLVMLPEKVRGLLARPFFWSTALHEITSSPIKFVF